MALSNLKSRINLDPSISHWDDFGRQKLKDSQKEIEKLRKEFDRIDHNTKRLVTSLSEISIRESSVSITSDVINMICSFVGNYFGESKADKRYQEIKLFICNHEEALIKSPYLCRVS